MVSVDDFLSLARDRYSCRKFQNRKVEKDKMMKVLEAARIAPSAANLQPWSWFVVEQPDMLEKIRSCYAKSWIRTAPAIIVVCGDHSKSWKRFDGKDHCDIDIAIAIDHMTLAATASGLATCWVCNFQAEQCKAILQLPDPMEAIALLPIGYPEDQPEEYRHNRLRKSIDDLTHWY